VGGTLNAQASRWQMSLCPRPLPQRPTQTVVPFTHNGLLFSGAWWHPGMLSAHRLTRSPGQSASRNTAQSRSRASVAHAYHTDQGKLVKAGFSVPLAQERVWHFHGCIQHNTPVTSSSYGDSRLTHTVERVYLGRHNASLYLFLHPSLPCSVSRMQSDGGKASVGSGSSCSIGQLSS
jgi:hypothetical protein